VFECPSRYCHPPINIPINPSPDELREMPLWLSRADMAKLHGVSERTVSLMKLKKPNIPDPDPRHLSRLRWYKPNYIAFIYG
jgi:hypothetical protein